MTLAHTASTRVERDPPSAGRLNRVRELRIDRMMSKAELARRAAVSALTIDRIERGYPCRMDTKRKILEALGYSPAQRSVVFPEEDR
jgi:DNA-binding XRE family transcriptional regulator